jgi:hypothetical protein
MRTLFATTAVLLLAATAMAELDLRPRLLTIGGGLIKRAYFTDGEDRYSVTIDDETTLKEFENGAEFRFTNVPHAIMRLRKSPLPKTPEFRTETLPEFVKAAAGLLPPLAEGAVVEGHAFDVFPVNRWKSVRLVFSYKFGGLQFKEHITFLTLGDGQQIVISAASRDKDFEAIAERADDIMRRWDKIQPGDELGEN